jgi:hypothetical protein
MKPTTKYSEPQLSGIQASIILMQLGKIPKNSKNHFRNKVAMCICSPVVQ